MMRAVSAALARDAAPGVFENTPWQEAASAAISHAPYLKRLIERRADLIEAVDADWPERLLREALVDGLGLKPKFAFGPVRLAITGSNVSPPLFESMELLGRESSLARLGKLQTLL